MRASRFPASPHFHPRSQDLAFLAVLFAATFYLMNKSYVHLAKARMIELFDASANASGKKGARVAADPGTEGLWSALFQTNFWFFILFGTLSYVIVPELLDSSVKYAGWIHGGVSTLLPAVLSYVVTKPAGKSKSS